MTVPSARLGASHSVQHGTAHPALTELARGCGLHGPAPREDPFCPGDPRGRQAYEGARGHHLGVSASPFPVLEGSRGLGAGHAGHPPVLCQERSRVLDTPAHLRPSPRHATDEAHDLGGATATDPLTPHAGPGPPPLGPTQAGFRETLPLTPGQQRSLGRKGQRPDP